jgi:hypothetical protein
MKRIDLIIDALELCDPDRVVEALAAARELQAEKQEPRKEWVGLNWDDIPDVFVGDIAFMQGAKWALAKLKEKNT